MDSAQCFRFIRVEEYFKDYKKWYTVDSINSYSLDADKKVVFLEL